MNEHKVAQIVKLRGLKSHEEIGRIFGMNQRSVTRLFDKLDAESGAARKCQSYKRNGEPCQKKDEHRGECGDAK